MTQARDAAANPIRSRNGQAPSALPVKKLDVIAVLELAFPYDEPAANARWPGPDVHGVCEVDRALLAAATP